MLFQPSRFGYKCSRIYFTQHYIDFIRFLFLFSVWSIYCHVLVLCLFGTDTNGNAWVFIPQQLHTKQLTRPEHSENTAIWPGSEAKCPVRKQSSLPLCWSNRRSPPSSTMVTLAPGLRTERVGRRLNSRETSVRLMCNLEYWSADLASRLEEKTQRKTYEEFKRMYNPLFTRG